jgi:hypothetical protein
LHGIYHMVYTIWYIPIASWYIPSKSGIYHEATFQMDITMMISPSGRLQYDFVAFVDGLDLARHAGGRDESRLGGVAVMSLTQTLSLLPDKLESQDSSH